MTALIVYLTVLLEYIAIGTPLRFGTDRELVEFALLVPTLAMPLILPINLPVHK